LPEEQYIKLRAKRPQGFYVVQVPIQVWGQKQPPAFGRSSSAILRVCGNYPNQDRNNRPCVALGNQSVGGSLDQTSMPSP